MRRMIHKRMILQERTMLCKGFSLYLNFIYCRTVRRWRDERREMIVTVRKCDRNGEVIGKNKTKFKAKETRRRLWRFYRSRSLPAKADYET